MSDDKNNKLAIIPRSVTEAMELSKVLASASTIGALTGKPADVLAAILAGQEMGFSPMAAIRAINVIKGKPVLGADAMVAVALSSGVAEYFQRVEEADTHVTYETKRKGAPSAQRCTWTTAMAKQAKLTGDNWEKYPRAMMSARAKSELARDVYPDLLLGCYTPEEAESFTDREPRKQSEQSAPPKHADAVDAELVEAPPAAPTAPTANANQNAPTRKVNEYRNDLNGSETIQAMQAIAVKMKADQKLTEDERAELRRVYVTRSKQIEAAAKAEGKSAA